MRHGVLLLAALFSFAAVAAANGGENRPAETARAAAGSHLVFTSNRDGDEDVYAADTNGRVAALTRNRLRDGELVLAKNGKWLAVEREYKLVLISGDGRRERMLGGGTAVGFSPNSRLLAFSRGLDDERMFVVGVPSGRPRALGGGYPIAFSPSGRLLAFSTFSDALGVVDVITGRRTIFPRSQFLYFLGWSRDSTRLALLRSEERGETTVKILLVANLHRPSSPPLTLIRSGEDLGAEWLTPRQIGFVRNQNGEEGCEAGVISASGGAPRVIGPADCFFADWSPRGDRIAYTRRLTANADELVIRQADGSKTTVVAQGQVSGFQWSPRGAWLAVEAEEPQRLLVFRRDGRRLMRLALPEFQFSEAGSASSDERHLALEIPGGLGIVAVPQGKLRRVWTGTVKWEAQWVAGALPRSAPTAAPAPAPEVAKAGVLRSRGVVFELGSDGTRVAALLGESRVDCDHLVAWTAGTRRIVRFNRAEPCGDYRTYDFSVTLNGMHIRWKNFYCGNYCYVGGCSADIRRPQRRLCGEGDEVPRRPPRPAPPAETRQGVSIETTAGTIRLRRGADGRVRTIRPPGGAVDAELENNGLFYALGGERL